MNLKIVALAVGLVQMAMFSANADNAMGYKLLTPEAAAALSHNHGTLGVNIVRAEQVSDAGMTFDLMRVSQVRRGFPGAEAGLKAGDEIIAVDGIVFPSLLAFAAYIGSKTEGTPIAIDYIPAGGGPQKAQRVMVDIGVALPKTQPINTPTAPRQAMSTGTKIAIGVGAAALFGCYEMGCFSHKQPDASQSVHP